MQSLFTGCGSVGGHCSVLTSARRSRRRWGWWIRNKPENLAVQLDDFGCSSMSNPAKIRTINVQSQKEKNYNQTEFKMKHYNALKSRENLFVRYHTEWTKGKEWHWSFTVLIGCNIQYVELRDGNGWAVIQKQMYPATTKNRYVSLRREYGYLDRESWLIPMQTAQKLKWEAIGMDLNFELSVSEAARPKLVPNSQAGPKKRLLMLFIVFWFSKYSSLWEILCLHPTIFIHFKIQLLVLLLTRCFSQWIRILGRKHCMIKWSIFS